MVGLISDKPYTTGLTLFEHIFSYFDNNFSTGNDGQLPMAMRKGAVTTYLIQRLSFGSSARQLCLRNEHHRPT